MDTVSEKDLIKQGIKVPKTTWLDFDQAVIDYKRAHREDTKKTTLINNSFSAFLNAHKRIYDFGRVDTLEFIRTSTESFALAAERYAKVKGIPVSEVKWQDVANWLSDLAVEHGGVVEE